MPSMRTLRCHVIASAGSAVEPLLRVLVEQGVEVDGSLMAPAGETVPLSLRRQLARADFVVAVIEDQSSSVVMLELGVAIGIGKPVFLVSVRTPIPFVLNAIPSLKVPDLADESLAFHLQQFRDRILSGGLKSPRPRKVDAREKPVFSEWASRRSVTSEWMLEREVAAALEMVRSVSSVSFGAERSMSASAPDIVAWFDQLPGTLSNPLIVEVKETLQSRRRAVDKLQPYLLAANTKNALLVVDRLPDAGISAEKTDSGYVFVMSLATLYREIESGEFLEVLVRARNAVSHLGGD